jgi:hypothetical protein
MRHGVCRVAGGAACDVSVDEDGRWIPVDESQKPYTVRAINPASDVYISRKLLSPGKAEAATMEDKGSTMKRPFPSAMFLLPLPLIMSTLLWYGISREFRRIDLA